MSTSKAFVRLEKHVFGSEFVETWSNGGCEQLLPVNGCSLVIEG